MCLSRKPVANPVGNPQAIRRAVSSSSWSAVPTSKSGGIVPRSVARHVRELAVEVFRNATKVTGRIKAGCSVHPGRADLAVMLAYSVKPTYKPGLVATIKQLGIALDEAYSRAPFRDTAQEFRDFFWRDATERLARLDYVLGQPPKLTKEEKAL